MAAGVDSAAEKAHNSTFTGNGLQYNYDAELAAVLPFNVKIPFDNITEARRVEAEGMAEELRARAELPKDPNVFVEDLVLPGAGGSPDLPIRIYTPARRTTSVGALLFFHGGGYVLGTLDNEELRCVHFAGRVNCVVVSPDYRLAPEHPFPAAFDDCYRTLSWLVDEGPRLGVDVGRIAVGGISSGGGLAASLAQRARDEHGPELALQLLLYPTLDSRLRTVSNARFTDTPLWDAHSNRAMWKYYLADSDYPASYAAPALAESFEGLPPAMLAVAELDPLRDEALEYASALLKANVSVELHLYAGTYHAFDYIAPFAQVSQRALADQVTSLSKALRS
jgi:acetyl esterase/lipase